MRMLVGELLIQHVIGLMEIVKLLLQKLVVQLEDWIELVVYKVIWDHVNGVKKLVFVKMLMLLKIKHLVNH